MSDMIPNNPLMQVMDVSMELGAVCIITSSFLCSLDVFFELGNLLLVGI
jgi:hypothetical protein